MCLILQHLYELLSKWTKKAVLPKLWHQLYKIQTRTEKRLLPSSDWRNCHWIQIYGCRTIKMNCFKIRISQGFICEIIFENVLSSLQPTMNNACLLKVDVFKSSTTEKVSRSLFRVISLCMGGGLTYKESKFVSIFSLFSPILGAVLFVCMREGLTNCLVRKSKFVFVFYRFCSISLNIFFLAYSSNSGEDSTMQITIRSDHSSSREVNDDSIVKSDAENIAGEKKKFMKLQCPHCNVKTVTFSVSSMIASRYIKVKAGPSKNKPGHLRN